MNRHRDGGDGEEDGAYEGADAGHAQQDFGGAVAAKSALDELVDVFELLVEGDHSLRHVGHQLGGQL